VDGYTMIVVKAAGRGDAMGSEARRRGLAILAAAVLGAAGGPFSARPGAALAETTLRSPATISAVDVLARVTAADQPLASYAVPVHIEARLHRLFTFHFGLDGMVYYKRPDRLALDMHHVPSDFRRLFGELGTPLTWSSTYDMNVVSASVAGGRTTCRAVTAPSRRCCSTSTTSPARRCTRSGCAGTARASTRRSPKATKASTSCRVMRTRISCRAA